MKITIDPWNITIYGNDANDIERIAEKATPLKNNNFEFHGSFPPGIKK